MMELGGRSFGRSPRNPSVMASIPCVIANESSRPVRRRLPRRLGAALTGCTARRRPIRLSVLIANYNVVEVHVNRISHKLRPAVHMVS